MCRLLSYIGYPIQLEQILCKPEHSLIVQSYQPKEMQEALLNADGFGIGWYHTTENIEPYRYRNVQPIWSDLNLSSLSRYIQSRHILAYVRSATPGQAVNLNNCQPFQSEKLMFIHNGYIQDFRESLYKPIRDILTDTSYRFIEGNTDSEHLFALFKDNLKAEGISALISALETTLYTVEKIAHKMQVRVLANMIICDGHSMVASRYAVAGIAPSLYWIKNDPNFPESVIIASEPLFPGKWHLCPEQSIISVGEDCDIHIQPLTKTDYLSRPA